MKLTNTFIPLIAFSLVASCAADLNITDWNVTAYEKFDNDTNTTYFQYKGIMGDTITWTGKGVNDTYMFEDAEDYELCDFTNATLVDGGVFESWPEGALLQTAVTGSRYYGLDDGEVNCTKIEINFKNKATALKGQQRECSESQTGLINALTFKSGGFGECKKACVMTRECKTAEVVKTKGSWTCTLYSDEAVLPLGNMNRNTICYTIIY